MAPAWQWEPDMRFLPLYRYYRFIGMNPWDAARTAYQVRSR